MFGGVDEVREIDNLFPFLLPSAWNFAFFLFQTNIFLTQAVCFSMHVSTLLTKKKVFLIFLRCPNKNESILYILVSQ